VGVDQPRDEPLLRELIHNPTELLLDVYKIFFRELALRIFFTYNRHPKALPGSPGITKLHSLFEPFGLSAFGSASG
jgi:hypothetical protein